MGHITEIPNPCSNHTGFGHRIRGLQSCSVFSLLLWRINCMVVLEDLVVIHICCCNVRRQGYRHGTGAGYQMQFVLEYPSFRVAEAPPCVCVNTRTWHYTLFHRGFVSDVAFCFDVGTVYCRYERVNSCVNIKVHLPVKYL